MSRRPGDFPKSVKRAARERAQGRCEAVGAAFGLPIGVRCNMPLDRGCRFEHLDPEANSRDGSLENCAVVCPSCWRYKTDRHDRPIVAKTARQKDKHNGIRPTPSRPFPGGRTSKWKRPVGGGRPQLR